MIARDSADRPIVVLELPGFCTRKLRESRCMSRYKVDESGIRSTVHCSCAHLDKYYECSAFGAGAGALTTNAQS